MIYLYIELDKDDLDMKKIEIAKQFLKQNIDLFRCPVCKESFINQVDNSIVCPNNHSLDISKKGTIQFINHKVNTEYDGDMLESRRRIMQAGFFDGILQKINEMIDAGHKNIVDIGSGEGTPLKRLEDLRKNVDSTIGFDISKPGVNLSTSELSDQMFFCVADLANLPFNDQSIDIIMDLFSPSAYKEFNRIIAPNGHLIKIVPNSHYLFELRQKLYGNDSENSSYDNQKVVDLFMEHYPNAKKYDVKYTVELPKELTHDLMIMTPLHWGHNAKDLTQAEVESLTSITVDVSILDNQF